MLSPKNNFKFLFIIKYQEIYKKILSKKKNIIIFCIIFKFC